MHELSIVMSIIDMVQKEALPYHANSVESIDLEIGELSGIEIDAFHMAWKQAVKKTLLQQAQLHVHRTAGEGYCMLCSHHFSMKQLFDACPLCNNHLIEIIKGKAMRVQSFTLPD